MDNVKRIQDYSRVPDYLQKSQRWLLYRFVFNKGNKKLSKVPFYVDGTPRSGTLNSAEDVAKLATFERANAALKEHDFDGLGFALGEDGEGYWQGLDLDDVSERPEFNTLLKAGIPGYVERSPSGNGIHAIGYGRSFQALSSEDIEAYSTARFFTVTGNIISVSDAPEDLYDYIEKIAQRLRGVELKPLEKDYSGYTYSGSAALTSEDQKRDLRAALAYLDADDYHEWVNTAMALKTCDAGLELWLEWSARSSKFNRDNALRKWNRDVHPERTSYQAVFNRAEQKGWVNPRRGGGTSSDYSYQPQLVRLPEFEYDIDNPQPTEFVIDGFIAAGIFLIAGYPGVGKTNFIVSLAAQVAHITKQETPFRPLIRRKVIYITEDPEQVTNILRGIRLHGDLIENNEEIRKWFHIIYAERTNPRVLKETLALVKQHMTEHVYEDKMFPAKPLVVIDTTNATIELESENDNSEVGRAVNDIKKGLAGVPCWLVTHTSKTVKRAEFDDLTARGATAWEGDTRGNAFLFKDEDAPENERFMRLGKRRFVARYQELKAVSTIYSEELETPWGPPQKMSYLVNVIDTSSIEEREENKERRKEERSNSVRMARNIQATKIFEEILERARRNDEVVVARNGKGPGLPPLPPQYARHRKLNWENDIFDVMDKAKDSSVRKEIKEYLKEKFNARYDGDLIIFIPSDYNISAL